MTQEQIKEWGSVEEIENELRATRGQIFEITEYIHELFLRPEGDWEVDFSGWSSKDYVNYLADLVCNKFKITYDTAWEIAYKQLNK